MDAGEAREVIIKEYKKDVRGRDWESFYYDERAICRRLATCPGVAPFVGVGFVLVQPQTLKLVFDPRI